MSRKVVLAAVVVILIGVAVAGGFVSLAADQGKLTRTQRQLSLEAETARWIAMAEFCARQNAAATFDPVSVAAADAARWVAMGEYYSRLAESQCQLSIQADAARWIAKGQYYAGLKSAAKAEAARWVAMGEYYAKLNETRRQLSLQAEAARWTAMGEFYLKHAQTQTAAHE